MDGQAPVGPRPPRARKVAPRPSGGTGPGPMPGAPQGLANCRFSIALPADARPDATPDSPNTTGVACRARPRGPAPDFIRQIVRDDLASGSTRRCAIRFPPEPNGYPHPRATPGRSGPIPRHRPEFGGACNLRLDDTNPAKEDPEYVRAIRDDVRWLG